MCSVFLSCTGEPSVFQEGQVLFSFTQQLVLPFAQSEMVILVKVPNISVKIVPLPSCMNNIWRSLTTGWGTQLLVSMDLKMRQTHPEVSKWLLAKMAEQNFPLKAAFL